MRARAGIFCIVALAYGCDLGRPVEAPRDALVSVDASHAGGDATTVDASSACVAHDGGPRPMPWADASVDAGPGSLDARDVVSTAITIDVATLHGAATIDVAASASAAAITLEIGALTIDSVSGPDGAISYAAHDGLLDVALPADATSISIAYAFPERARSGFDGWMPASAGSAARGLTFLWPYYCGNLFPCHSDPADGARFTLAVTGVPAGSTAVFPTAIPFDVPAYVPAIAIDDRFVFHDLGATSAGTHVGVYAFASDDAAAIAATAHLRDAFDFYETLLGPYRFGDHVASVEADWGPGGFGGMEHHPLWHVGAAAIGSPEVHVHEAAHGWFGDGVRLRCWEDFVLSEGTVSYLAARAIEATGGAAAGDAVWAGYQRELTAAIAAHDVAAYPRTCGAIRIATDPLWSDIPYMKGAFFYRAVEERIGRGALDRILRDFYAAHVGQAATMQEMIDAIEDGACIDVGDLEEAWLRGLGDPSAP